MRAALAALGVLVPAIAGADPKVVAVSGSLDGATANLHVRYTIAIERPHVAYQLAMLAMPAGGLVTHGEVTVDGARHALALLDHDAASRALDELIARPGTHDRGWAVTLEKQDGGVAIGAAVPRAATLGIELDVAVPTCFYADARYAALPAEWGGVLDRALRPQLAAATITAHCSTTVAGAWAALPATALAKQPAGPARIGASAGRIALGAVHLARAELDLAGTLSEVPADLATAIVIDASRSLSPAQLDTERELVLAYLRAAPHARIQVIAYARTARALLPAWTDASQAAAKLDRALRALAPRNGSNVDEGLDLAGSWLARTTGTRRAIVLTDELLADRLADRDATTLRRLLPDGALAHVVAIHGDGAPLERDESIKLAGLAIATDGLAAHLGTSTKLDATALARPISLDAIQLRAPGWSVAALTPASCTARVATLPEGGACTWWAEGDAIAGPITIEGLLWGRRVTKLVTPELARAESLARELVDQEAVDAALRDRIAVLAHAVDAKWSMIATWGGRDGYAGVAASGMGFAGSHSFDDGVLDDSLVGPPTVTPPLDLRAQVASAIAPCKAAKVEVEIETTLQEIVGVEVADTGPPAATRACVETAIWDLALAIPNAPEHATTHVALP